MKGHRSRGKARRVVVAGYGRHSHVRDAVVIQDAAGITLGAGSMAPFVRSVAPSIVRSAKEKQAFRAARAKAKGTPWTKLGRAIRSLLGIP